MDASSNLNEIKAYYQKGTVQWRQHMLLRMQQRGISINDIQTCIQSSTIIEEYQDDYPYPSCLICGPRTNGDLIHLVCAIASGSLWLITAYVPDPAEWEADMITRRMKNE